jgi:hypothetical protein
MTREEKNRKLAEWLGWTEIRLMKGCSRIPSGFAGIPPRMKESDWLPDFYSDEAANALARNRLAQESKVLRIIITQSGYTTVIAGSETAPDAAYEHSDYMTAIGETCIKWIEKPKEQG